MRRALWAAQLGATLVAGCNTEETVPAPVEPPPNCNAPEIALPDGSCFRPGVPPDGCAEGFTHDGEYGCDPILPATSCPDGLMAVPGDAECRPVMTCGTGKWGDIPVDASTQYVDASFTGTSDGSAQSPWKNILSGFLAAAPGAIVALAEGSYPEQVVVVDKSVKLWGVCPERVDVVGDGDGAVIITAGADGTELHGLAIRGGPIFVSGARDVLIDRVWIHDSAVRGIELNDTAGPASAIVSGSLLENNQGINLFVSGDAELTSSVVRGTVPSPSEGNGTGIQIQDCGPMQGCPTPKRSSLGIARSLIEENYNVGVYVIGSDVTIGGTVVRGTLPGRTNQRGGRAIGLELSCTEPGVCDPSLPSNGTIVGSFLERSHDASLAVIGSVARVENTVVRDTRPRAENNQFGRGIAFEPSCTVTSCDPASSSEAWVSRSLIEKAHDVGLFVMGSEAHIDGVVVRDIEPRASEGYYGRGISIGPACPSPVACMSELISTAEITSTLVERTHDIGVFVPGGVATIDGVVVRDVLARTFDGNFGDGIALMGGDTVSNTTITRTHITKSARAGLASFGAQASLGGNTIQCAIWDLEGETYLNVAFELEDRGGNRCGCPVADTDCIVVSPGLEPPRVVEP
jgi:hypothetical protein